MWRKSKEFVLEISKETGAKIKNSKFLLKNTIVVPFSTNYIFTHNTPPV